MGSSATLTVDMLMKTGSFETDSERAARTAERNFKRVGKAANDGADEVEKANRRATQSMRMVGPQITDIVTQLQGGQNPLTILTQQGGQLKDMFGGVGPAVQAVGGYVAGLINPLTLTAAAVAALGYAFYVGSQQQEAFNKALQLGGNYAGVTQAKIEDLAHSMGAGTGDVGKFRDILNQLVSSGQVAGQNLQGFAQAIQDVSRLSGETTEKVTADFLSMSKGVADWAAEHNRQYHFITTAQYEHIKQLEEEGRAQEAMEEVARRLHEYLGKDATQNIGFLTQSYLGWKQVIDGVVQSLLGLGRAQTATDQIRKLGSDLDALQKRRDFFGGLGRDTTQIDQEIEAGRQRMATLNQKIIDDQAAADKKAADARVQQAGIDAARYIDAQLKALDKGYAKREALEKARREHAALVAANPNSPLATPESLAMLEAGINERYKPAAPKKDRAAEKAAREAAAVEKAFQDAVARGQNAEAQEALKQEEAFQKAITEGLTKEAQTLTANVDNIRQSLQTAEQTENESYNKRLENLKAYGEQSADMQAEANLLIEAERQRHEQAMQSMQASYQMDAIARTAGTFDQIYQLFVKSGREQSGLAKAAFLASKALAVAEILIQTEVAAAKAVGQLGIFGLPLSAVIRATGYAQAGLVAGMAIAGQRANGGPVEAGKQYIVGERGREAFIPTTSGMIIPNHVLEGAGATGGEKLTIVNNTRGRIDNAHVRQISATERAIIIDEAISAVAGDMSNPNSRTSRSLQRNTNIQRSRT